MKTNNIFDYMENDAENIDEASVIETTGVSTDNVKKLFMEKMNGQNKTVKKTKKHGKKKIFVLAAAVAATLAVGTVGAGAAGSFDEVFGEHFAGTKISGVYAGANVKVTSAEGYNTEFLGISGDRHNAMAAIKITKSDGTFYVPDDTKYTYVSPFLYGPVFDEDFAEITKKYSLSDDDVSYTGSIDVTKSLWNQITNVFSNDNGAEGGSPEFILEDDKTLKYIGYYSGGKYGLIGETMSMYEPVVYLYSVKRDVMECNMDEGFDAVGIMTDSNHETYTPKAQEIAEKLTAVKNNLKANEYLIVNHERYIEGKMAFSVVEISMEKIDLSGSWKLNYRADAPRDIHLKDNEYTLEGSANGHDFSEVKIHITSVQADTFTTSIYMEFEGNITNYDVEENGNFVNKWYDSFFDYSNNIVITLENGESVEGYFSTTHMDYDEHGGYYSGQIVYVKNNHTVSIAANEIVSLKINGVELI